MRVKTHEFYGMSSKDTINLYPLGDVHDGAQLCDLETFESDVKRIANDPNGYWVGMGDYADFITLQDPRWDVDSVADWLVEKRHLRDIAKAQVDHFTELVEPIAGKCLGLLKGNHEESIRSHYERDVYLEIVSEIKRMGGFEPDEQLALGYYGWLQLKFYRSEENETKHGSSVINGFIHHGYGGGRLAGGKALKLERVIQRNRANFVLMGHLHSKETTDSLDVYVDRTGSVRQMHKVGAFTGTYLASIEDGEKGMSYGMKSGYPPSAVGGIELIIEPYDDDRPVKRLT